MHTHVALLRGVNNLGGKKVTMAELREVVSSLGHADVVTYIQSGNVLFTPRPADGGGPGRVDAEALASELERAVADGLGVRARAENSANASRQRAPEVPPNCHQQPATAATGNQRTSSWCELSAYEQRTGTRS